MALLMLNARLPAIITNQRQARWDQIFTPRIAGKTVLIVGVGDMGGAVAGAARRSACASSACAAAARRTPTSTAWCRSGRSTRVLPEADFVVLAVPLTPETPT